MTEPHHKAARQPTDDERDAVIKAAAERHAQQLANSGMDPGEAIIVGYGRAVGEDHHRRCPGHTAERCVDQPSEDGPDDAEALRVRRDAILARLRGPS